MGSNRRTVSTVNTALMIRTARAVEVRSQCQVQHTGCVCAGAHDARKSKDQTCNPFTWCPCHVACLRFLISAFVDKFPLPGGGDHLREVKALDTHDGAGGVIACGSGCTGPLGWRCLHAPSNSLTSSATSPMRLSMTCNPPGIMGGGSPSRICSASAWFHGLSSRSSAVCCSSHTARSAITLWPASYTFEQINVGRQNRQHEGEGRGVAGHTDAKCQVSHHQAVLHNLSGWVSTGGSSNK